MNLSTIYADNVSTVTSSTSYDPAQLMKNWVRPLQSGDDPSDFWEYSYARIDNSAAPTYVSWHTYGMTKGAAANANIPPVGYTGAESSGTVPVPMDRNKIPAGYTLTGTPFGLSLVANPAPAPSGTADDRILAGLNALLQHFSLPTV